MIAHTPTPWKRQRVLEITADNGRILVARLHCTLGKTEPEIVNADFIVHACNSHDALVAAVEHAAVNCRECLGNGIATKHDLTTHTCQVCKPYRAALKAAKGEA